MTFRKNRFLTVGLSLACASAALWLAADVSAESKPSPRKSVTSRITLDETAERIALFDGIEGGQLDVLMIPKDANGGNLLVENKTDKPLTIELPESFVGVQVLKQFGGMMGGGMMGGGMMGGAQSTGGGAGGLGGGGLGGAGGAGQGFFSVPPDQIVRVPYNSVCLNHGKPDPKPSMTYRLVRTEQYTDNPALRELLAIVADGKVNPQVAQAAAWHLTDDMSWHELAAKTVKRLGGAPPTPYFTQAELYYAQSLVAVATAQAQEKAKVEGNVAPTSIPSRVNPSRVR